MPSGAHSLLDLDNELFLFILCPGHLISLRTTSSTTANPPQSSIALLFSLRSPLSCSTLAPPPTTARPSLSPPPSLASLLNYCPRKLKRKALVRLGLCYPLVVISNSGLKSTTSDRASVLASIALILQGPYGPKRKLEGNMINVAECGQTRTHRDMLLLFSYASFSNPFPAYFPPSYSFFSL